MGNKTLLVRMYFSCLVAGSYLASLGDSSSSPDTSPQKDTEPQTIPRTKRMPEKPKGKYGILSITHLDYLLQPYICTMSYTCSITIAYEIQRMCLCVCVI